MWRLALLVVILLVHIASPQPVTTDKVEATRETRQLNFGECCPCSDEPSFINQDRWLNPNIVRNSPNGNGGQFLNNGLGSSRSGFDDCPCRLRNADSEGSSSIFFPSALSPTDSSLKSGSKEDPKNLLEPEVGLASSVLETLRKATDEEYRDALARDSARARQAEDALPEESAQNIVTIILPSQDDEDIISESHKQTPRCIRPLGSPISRMRSPLKRPPNVVTEIFKMPKPKSPRLLHRHSLNIDSGVGASNVQERVMDTDGRNRKLKTNKILVNSEEDNVCETNFRKAPSLNSLSSLNTEKDYPGQNDVLRSSNHPKIRLDSRSRDVCDTHNTDMKSAASDTKELFAEPGLKLNSLTSGNHPLNLKTLLKLRDVELFPPKQLIEKLKLNSPALQLPPLIENMPKLSDLLKNGIKFNLNKNGQWNNAKDDVDSVEGSTSNIQVIPREKSFTTEILDGLPSSSNIMEVKDSCSIEQETLKNDIPFAPGDKTIATPISKAASSDIIKDNDVIDNSLRKVSKMTESDFNLLEDMNNDATSNENISSKSNSDVLIRSTESRENVHPNTQSDEMDQELGASNCLEDNENEQKSSEIDGETPLDYDAVFDSDNQSQNPIEEKRSSQDKQSIITMNDTKMLRKQSELPLSKSLTSVKEGLLRKIEERKKTAKLNKAAELRESNAMNDIQMSDIENSKQDCQEDATRILSVLPDALDTDSRDIKSSKESDKVQFEDLQKLSDALLKKSLINDKSSSTVESNNFNDAKFNTRNSGLNDRADKLVDDYNGPTFDSDIASNNHFAKLAKDPSSRNVIQRNDDGDRKEESICSVGLIDGKKSLKAGPDVNEMTADASEPVIGTQWHDPLQLFRNSRLGSPLFQNAIVEPSSLFDSMSGLPGLDLPGALNLPTLDDIRERLANVFGIQAKGSSVEEFDCTNENPIMAAEPSTSNFISKSPVLPLEDLNLDIFQLKPLTMGKSSTLSKTPGLNLKSFRTKVPVPKNLDFKPLRLQSTVGNDGGLLGAALTLGRNTEDAPKLFDTLGNSLQNIPSLQEMMTRVRSNVENVVSPLDLSRSSSSKTLISDLSHNLRSNAENTIRALQHRMGSSLGQTNNLLTHSASTPHELLGRIADAKEDFEAKFKGLQYDLNDRLTSIHENLLDKTVLPSLNPLFQEGGLSRNAFGTNNQNTRFQNLPVSAAKKLKLESKKQSIGKTANFKNKQNTVTTPRKFKMPTAASVPVPKTVEVPKLKSVLDKSVSSPRNNLKINPIASRTNPLRLENKLKANLRSSKLFEETSPLGKHASSLKENKVKVTFGSTTPVPISTLRSQQRMNSNNDAKPSNDLRRSDNGLRRLGLKQKSSVEPHESPSEMQPIFRSLTSESSEFPDCNDEIYPLTEAKDQNPFLDNQRNAMRPTLKQRNNLKPKSAISDVTGPDTESASSLNPLPLPSWPKFADTSFLSKVRDAVKARLSNFDLAKPVIETKPKAVKPCSDMERSASQNTDVVVGDSLKENVSYKCRMVCTNS